MPAGVNTGTPRSTADLLELYADYKPAHTSNRQLQRDLIMSLDTPYVKASNFGAIADGVSHPLSDYFATLPIAQATYPAALALTDELDWAALQKALDAADAAGGNEVKIARGTYMINRSLTQGSNVKVSGVPGSVLKATTANLNLLFAIFETGCQAEGLTLDGNNLGAIGILYSVVTSFKVNRCKITGFTTLNAASYGGGVHGYLCDDSSVENCDFSGNGTLVGGLTSDIQINGNGAAADCTKRVKIHNNRCLSVAVQTNIVCYDVAYSKATENECSGAKTQATNNNGYGIIFYGTVAHNPGTARRNRIEDNLVYAVGGCAIYVQAQDDCAVVGNVGEDWGAVQDDSTLLVGLVGFSNSPRGIAIGNVGYNGNKAGIVIGGNVFVQEGFTCSGNSFTHMNGGYGFSFRGAISKSVFDSNALKDVGHGFGTPPVDQGIEGCTFVGNTVDGTTQGYGFILYGCARCTFTGNSVFHSWRSGFALAGASPGNVFIGNHSWDGSLIGDNLYSAFELGGSTDTVLIGNHGGNTGVTGYAYGILMNLNALRSVVTNNKMGGARTLNFSVDATFASKISFFGNFDLSVADAHIFAARQFMRIQGTASQVTQLYLGDPASAAAVGTRWSSGEWFAASNAVHNQGADSWHQSNAAVASKLIILRNNGDFEFYSAPIGTADGTFAVFWGTAKGAFEGTAGRVKLAGTQVLTTRNTGWTAQTAAASKADLGAAPTVNAIASWASAIQAMLTGHGILGP